MKHLFSNMVDLLMAMTPRVISAACWLPMSTKGIRKREEINFQVTGSCSETHHLMAQNACCSD